MPVLSCSCMHLTPQFNAERLNTVLGGPLFPLSFFYLSFRPRLLAPRLLQPARLANDEVTEHPDLSPFESLRASAPPCIRVAFTQRFFL